MRHAAVVCIVLAGCDAGGSPDSSSSPVPRVEAPDSATNAVAGDQAEAERFYELNDLAKQSFKQGKIEQARKYANELMAALPKYQGDWNYGNAVHDSHLVLGRIAVVEGDMDQAKKHLIAAGKTPGSPQLDSFGPNVSLAKDLIDKGEAATAIEYFSLCKNFWKLERGRLDQWSEAVKASKTPDFGANLLY